MNAYKQQNVIETIFSFILIDYLLQPQPLLLFFFPVISLSSLSFFCSSAHIFDLL